MEDYRKGVGHALMLFDVTRVIDEERRVPNVDGSYTREFLNKETGNLHTQMCNAKGKATREIIYVISSGEPVRVSDSNINPTDGSYVKEIFHETQRLIGPIAIEVRDKNGIVTTKDTQMGELIKDPLSGAAEKRRTEALKKAALPSFGL